MFKKVEVWIIYLILIFSIPFSIGFGALVRYEMMEGESLRKYNMGWLPKFSLFLAEIPSNLKEIIPKSTNNVFVISEDRFQSLKGFSGTPNDQETYLLFSRYNGDLKEPTVELIDLTNFEVMHTWNPDIDKFNKQVNKINEFKYLERDRSDNRSRLRHPLLLSDGGLVFQNQVPLRKIDACSNLIFQNEEDIFHHSIETDHEGNIWVASSKYPQTLPITKVGRKTSNEGGFIDDAIVKLNKDGEILFEKSVSQIFIDNDLEYLLFSVGDKRFIKDPIHLNDIQPVNFDSKYWKKGDLFLSLRHQSMILLFRPSTNKIVWKSTGQFYHQHDIDILDNHRISILNNNSKDFNKGNQVDGHNEVLIYDFKEKQYTKYLANSLIKNDVRTITEGISEILPNGDLFFEETNYGRTLYFNANGSLRWSNVNRADNGYIYASAWSRILYKAEDIKNVKNFLRKKINCEFSR